MRGCVHSKMHKYLRLTIIFRTNHIDFTTFFNMSEDAIDQNDNQDVANQVCDDATAGDDVADTKRDDPKRSKEAKHKRQLEWISGLTFKNVVLDSSMGKIVSIGGQVFETIPVPIIATFLRQQDVKVLNRKRKKSDMEGLILQHMTGTQYRQKLQSASKKKTNAATKPACLIDEGTLYRSINVITSEMGKSFYISTRKQFQKDDLDGKLAHNKAWEELASLYQTENDDIDNIHDPNKELVGFAIDADIAKSYDTLGKEDMKAIVDYIIAHYKEAMNMKVVSGQHLPFSNFVHGKHWLLYLHNRLDSLGDKALIECCYVELDDDVKIVGTQTILKE